MSLNIKRIQLTENGIAQDVDILTSAECVTFEDGENLQDKYDNGDIASVNTIGDVSELNGDIVTNLNELNASSRANTELIEELANRPSVAMALKKEVASGEWGSVSTLPYPFQSGDAVVVNNEIHILGSNNSSTYYKYHYKYDGSTWGSDKTLPFEFRHGHAVVLNNEIHILGGFGNKTAHYKYNGSSWSSVSTLPHDFYQGGVVVLDDKLHILGGNGNYTKHYKYNGSSWESVSTLPYSFYEGSTLMYDNKIHILGGSGGQTSHYKYNDTVWESVSTLPYNFVYGSVVVYNGEIHIMGSNQATICYYHYKWNNTEWTKVSTLTNPVCMSSAVVNDKKIHILGGFSSSVTINKNHYSAGFGTTLKGYTKADTQLYLPISTTPCTSNLVATDDGYTVTEDGYVEILLNE